MKQSNPESQCGKYGWMAIVGFVTAWDAFAPETLTNAFMRGRESENRLVRAAVIGSWAITTAHLMDWIPEQYDPIDSLGNGLANVINKVGEWSVRGTRVP